MRKSYAGALSCRAWFVSVLTVVAGGFSGCASIVSGQTQAVSFNSSPPGAAVIVDGRVLGMTPMAAEVPRSSRSLTFDKQGFSRQTVPMIAVMNPWYWANIPFGGVILGMAVDGISGAWNQFQPDSYDVRLSPEVSAGTLLLREQRSQQALDFILKHYSELRVDITKSGGRYLRDFMEILEIPPVNQSDAQDRLRTLIESYSDVQSFAHAAVTDLTAHGYAFRSNGSFLRLKKEQVYLEDD